MTVAIDGPAGTGKSTVAKKIAERTGAYYLSSGGFYRAITWHALKMGLDLDSESTVSQMARSLEFDVRDEVLVVNGVELGPELRTPEVDRSVAALSALPSVRAIVDGHLRRIADQRDVVVEGRDMTTVVFPDAEVKIYLDASIDARAKRRFEELDGRDSLAEVRRAIAVRDGIDTTKPVGRLIVDPSALYIDSSDLTIDQVCEIVLRIILSPNNNHTGAIGQS